MINQQQVKDRLCQLTYNVMAEVFNGSIPADCWCGKREEKMAAMRIDWVTYQFSEDVLAFIEQAVRADIEARKEAKREAQAIMTDEKAWLRVFPPVVAMGYEDVL
jgi:hypothetical protein